MSLIGPIVDPQNPKECVISGGLHIAATGLALFAVRKISNSSLAVYLVGAIPITVSLAARAFTKSRIPTTGTKKETLRTQPQETQPTTEDAETRNQAQLKGKKAVVTGAGRGIGRAIALALAAEGCDVVISYRSSPEEAQRVVQEIKAMGRQAAAFYANWTPIQGVDAFYNQALEALGHIDIFVNNAGNYNTDPFLNLELAAFEEALSVGVAAPMRLTQLFARDLIKRKAPGSVINVSAISGVRPHLNRVAHATAKSALNMLTQCTALDLAPYQIRVNAMALGGIPSSSSEQDPNIPLGRTGTFGDVANMAVFLASEKSSGFTTGQVIVVDGGQSLSF